MGSVQKKSGDVRECSSQMLSMTVRQDREHGPEPCEDEGWDGWSYRDDFSCLMKLQVRFSHRVHISGVSCIPEISSPNTIRARKVIAFAIIQDTPLFKNPGLPQSNGLCHVILEA